MIFPILIASEFLGAAVIALVHQENWKAFFYLLSGLIQIPVIFMKG